MALEQFRNNGRTTLASGIDSDDVSLSVADGSVFPSVGNFRLKIDDELLLCTARSSNTLTVTRGAESTTPASHSSAALVDHILTAGSVSQRFADNLIVDAIGSRPAAGRAGALFLPTSSLLLQRDDGAAWQSMGPLHRFKVPPAVSGFTWVNQDTGTAVDEAASIYMTDPPHSGDDFRLLVRSAPSTPYTITAAFRPMLGFGAGTINMNFGLAFRESSSGKLATTSFAFASTTVRWEYAAFKMNSPTSASTHLVARKTYAGPFDIFWCRIVDDGSDRKHYISNDGVHWMFLGSEGRTTFLTANQVGIYLNANMSTAGEYDSAVSLLSYEES